MANSTEDRASDTRGLDEELKNSDAAGLLSTQRRAKFTPEQEAILEQQRQQNQIVAAVAGMSWGKNMTTVMRRAIADYCRRYDVDPVTEMDNLGGNVYVNGEWFIRKLGELRIRGIIKDFYLEHIHADPRLDALRKDDSLPPEYREAATKKWFDMKMKRIDHNAPEEAEAICVCVIILPNGSPIRGCKWAGNGTSVVQPRHNGGALPNPVAEANPTLSVETQSIRRALRQLMTHVTGNRLDAVHMPADLDAMGQELSTISEAARAGADMSAEASAGVEAREAQRTHMLNAGGYDEIAEFERQQAGRSESGAVVSTPTNNARPTLARFVNAESKDPYGFGDDPEKDKDNPFSIGPIERGGMIDRHDLSEFTTEKLNAEIIGNEPMLCDVCWQPLPNDPEIQEFGRHPACDKKVVEQSAPLISAPTGDDKGPALELTAEPEPEKELPKKRCFSCGEMVAGPYTTQHKPECPFHVSQKPHTGENAP